MCGLSIDVDGRDIVRVRGDEHDVLSRGYLCPKGPALAQLHADPDRLRRPRLRTAGGWRDIGWDEALDRAADGLHRVQAEHGRDALAVYLGNPSVHNLGVVAFGPPFLRALRTKHRYSATSVDQLPQMLVAHQMFGHQLLMAVPDVDRASHLVIVGGNPVVSNGSILSAPNMRARLKAIRARGGSVVVIDPRRTETAEIADEHHFVRPGTDALLLLAILSVILGEGRDQPGPLADLIRNTSRLRTAVERFTPERAAGPTGVAAPAIRRLAHEIVERRGVVYGRVGAATQAFGAVAHWAINLINVFSGALDRVGGAMFTQPAIDVLRLPRGLGVGPGAFGRWRSRVRGLPEFGGELPVASLAEDIVAGAHGFVGDNPEPLPAIRGLLTLAGNPALSSPQGDDLRAAIETLDFVVSIDLYANETTGLADLILPPTSPLERSHYDLAFHLFAIRNTAKWSPPLFEPPADARHDWQILHGLWTRILDRRGDAGMVDRGVVDLLGRLGPDGLVDLGLRAGRHGRVLPGGLGDVARHLPGRVGRRLGGQLSLDALREHPHGIDLGALEPCLRERLPEGHRFIDVAPAILIEDLGRLERAFPVGGPSWRPPTADRPRFELIGRRLLRSNNSWMHNLPKLVAGKPSCTLRMHPDDALELALRPGDRVQVRSRVGEVLVPLETSDEIMRGVVSLPHGFGHDAPEAELAVAREHAGASINDLSDAQRIDALSGVAAFSGEPVEVRLASGGG